MKKAMSKLLSAVLIMALVFTSGGMVFADTSSADEQMQAENAAVLQAASELSAAEIPQIKTKSVKEAIVKADNVLPLTNFVTGSETVYRYKVFPISQYLILKAPSNGVFYLNGTGANLTKGRVDIKIKTSPSASTFLESSSLYSGQKYNEMRVEVAKAGTYYLVVEPSYNASGYFDIGGAFINGTATRTLSNNKWSAVGVYKAKQTKYFKFKAKYTGYVTINTAYLSGEITLTNSRKRAVSNAVDSYSGGSQITFGVQKNRTYYIKALNNYTMYDGYYKIKYINKGIREKSGKNKSRAVLIKKKRTKKGTIVAGEKRIDWYKFKVTKKKRVRITIKGNTNNKLKYVIYKGRQRVLGGSGTLWYNSNGVADVKKLYGKLSKGTYYIKVYRGTKNSSGWYSLNWR